MILGIDIGTTSISIVVSRMDGTLLEVRTVGNDSALPGMEGFQRCQSPSRILQLVWPVYEELMLVHSLKRIGIACQMHGVLYVDRSGEAVSPLFTWQDESGVQPNAGSTYLDALNQITGYNMARGVAFGSITHFFLTKRGELPASAVKMCTIGDYLAMRLTGNTRPRTHVSNAAGIGLYRLAQHDFDEEAIQRADMDPSYYPEVCDGYALAGYTAQGVPVSVAIGDNQASFMGAVDDWDGEILLNLGTGGQISCRARAITETGGIETRPLVGDDYLAVFTSHCGGRAYAALEAFYRQVLEMAGIRCDSVYGAMERSMRFSAPAREKIIVRPAFCGTRLDPGARCEIEGLTLSNFTPANLSRGFLEGICAELYPFYERMRAQRSFVAITGAGNAIRRNVELQKAVREVFGLPLKMPRHAEEAACGAVFFAAHMNC